jgi:hypothetical protein
MRQILIISNWALSFFGLCIDTEYSPFWAVMLMIGWFAASSLLLRYAYRRGWLKDIVERLESMEL